MSGQSQVGVQTVQTPILNALFCQNHGVDRFFDHQLMYLVHTFRKKSWEVILVQFEGVLVIPEILDNVWTQNVWTQRCSCIEGFTTSQIYHAFNLNCSEPISARNEETIMWEQLWVMFPPRIAWTILVWTCPDSRKCSQMRSHGVGNPHNMVVFTSQ